MRIYYEIQFGIKLLYEEKIITRIEKKIKQNYLLESVSTKEIDKLASELAVQRGYPKALSQLLIKRH